MTKPLFLLALTAGLFPHASLAQLTALYAPSLLFNWTLYPADVPLVLYDFNTVSNDSTSATRVVAEYGYATVDFLGTGLAFLGSSDWNTTTSKGAKEATASATVNNDPSWDPSQGSLSAPAGPGILWERYTPRFLRYQMKLTTSFDFSGTLTLDGVQLTTGMNATASSLEEVPQYTQNFVDSDGKVNSFFNSSGRWEVVPAADPLPTYALCYDTASLQFDIPVGTAYFTLNGVRSRISSTFKFQLISKDNMYPTTWNYDASYSFSTTALMFMAPIDPTQEWMIKFTCDWSGSGQQGLTGMTFYRGTDSGNSTANTATSGASSAATSANGWDTWSATSGAAAGSISTSRSGSTGGTGSNSSNSNGSAKSSALSSGTIAGIAVGIVVALSALILAFVLWRRRQPPTPPKHDGAEAYRSGRFNDGIDGHLFATPYADLTPATPMSPASSTSPFVTSSSGLSTAKPGAFPVVAPASFPSTTTSAAEGLAEADLAPPPEYSPAAAAPTPASAGPSAGQPGASSPPGMAPAAVPPIVYQGKQHEKPYP